MAEEATAVVMQERGVVTQLRRVQGASARDDSLHTLDRASGASDDGSSDTRGACGHARPTRQDKRAPTYERPAMCTRGALYASSTHSLLTLRGMMEGGVTVNSTVVECPYSHLVGAMQQNKQASMSLDDNMIGTIRHEYSNDAVGV